METNKSHNATEGTKAHSGQRSVKEDTRPQSSDRKVVIHFGLHRTATTFLQDRFFRKLLEVDYIHKPCLARLKASPLPQSGRILVISKENLMLREGKGGVQYPRIVEVASQFPDALPILSLRRHERWLRSVYIHRVFKGDSRSFSEFVQDKQPVDYMLFIRALRVAFNRRPLIFLLEELEEDPEGTLEMLAGWIGSRPPHSQSYRRRNTIPIPESGLWLVLRFNRRFPKKSSSRSPITVARRKGRQLLIYLLAWTGAAFPQYAREEIIPEGALKRLKARYRVDWHSLLKFISEQRPLLTSSLQRELATLEKSQTDQPAQR